jgi:hypothetical protein
MRIKLGRKALLGITAGLGALIIVYSLIRHFTSFSPGETIERYLMDGIIIAALGLFMYNRKLASDERKAREAAEQERLKAEQAEAEDKGDEELPHWERGKKEELSRETD